MTQANQITNDTEKKLSWNARRIDVQEPWHAVLIALPSLPLEKSLRPELHEKLTSLVAVLRGVSTLQLSTWLLMDTLHQDGEVRKIAANGRLWVPDVGLGVWPDQEPPRMWSDEEMTEREHDAPLRPFMHTVIHISADESGCMHAWQTMAGTGSVIQLLLEKSPDEFHEEAKANLLPTIEDETFHGFSIYFPLLSVRSISGREASELERWLGSAAVYLRESPEDAGILLLSRIDPAGALRETGIADDVSLSPEPKPVR
ncbi:MAG TPA: hypothetical protein VHT24_11650 [Pseudacidobacterium sp.]|jgi:hypothetical protein|nr:hypothetical protein [Pseudacidobacterium sp.]